MSWSGDLRSSMKAQEKVRDAASAQALKTEHERIKAEIEAREDVFSRVVENGRTMIDEKHYANAEVQDRVNKVSGISERFFIIMFYQSLKVGYLYIFYKKYFRVKVKVNFKSTYIRLLKLILTS